MLKGQRRKEHFCKLCEKSISPCTRLLPYVGVFDMLDVKTREYTQNKHVSSIRAFVSTAHSVLKRVFYVSDTVDHLCHPTNSTDRFSANSLRLQLHLWDKVIREIWSIFAFTDVSTTIYILNETKCKLT